MKIYFNNLICNEMTILFYSQKSNNNDKLIIY